MSEIGRFARRTRIHGLAILLCLCLDPRAPNTSLLAERIHQSKPSYDPGTIVTIAGSGPPAWTATGDGGAATKAYLKGPWAIAADKNGSLFIAEPRASRIRKVLRDGTITTIAGTGRRGFSGDGGPATQAQINEPCGIAVADDGTVYFTDNDNWRIRKISPDGIIATIAGTGDMGYSGDGGPAIAARLSYPQKIVRSKSGELFFVDEGNHRIRKITREGTILTYAGIGKPGFSGDGGPANGAQLKGPQDIAFDSEGNLYIADIGNLRVRKVTPDGLITTFAGTGKEGVAHDGDNAIRTNLGYPSCLAVDARNQVYIGIDHYVVRVDASGRIHRIAGTGDPGFFGDGGPAIKAGLHTPFGLCFDEEGDLLIAELENRRVRRVLPNGTIGTVAGVWPPPGQDEPRFSGDHGPASESRLNLPSLLAVDQQGNVYIADSGNHRIRKIDPTGMITSVAGSGKEGFSGDGGPATAAQLNGPEGVAVDLKGNLYIADSSNHRIRKVDPQGRITTVAGTGKEGFSGDGGLAIKARLNYPFDVKVDGPGNLFVTDFENKRVRMIGPDGIIRTVAGGGKDASDQDFHSALDAQLTGPEGLALDKEGNLFIAETLTNRVRKLDREGTLRIVAGFNTARKGFSGDGESAIRAHLFNPVGLAVDARGNLFIADRMNDCVRMVSPDGIIRAIAGNASKPSGFSGDGGLARDASLNRPTGLALDAAGNLYVSDQNNHRVRKVNLAAEPSRR